MSQRLAYADPDAGEQYQIAYGYQLSTLADRQQRDGVIVTPVEIVDFINRAMTDTLHALHGVDLTDPQVRVIDPFGGTGIFTARLLQTCGLSPHQIDELYHHRLLVIEIDPAAAQTAQSNLCDVFRRLVGHTPRKRVVHCADTFTLGDDDIERMISEGWDE